MTMTEISDFGKTNWPYLDLFVFNTYCIIIVWNRVFYGSCLTELGSDKLTVFSLEYSFDNFS